MIWHNKFILFDNWNSCSTHHRPWIINSLTSSHLSICLLTSICKAMDHLSCRNILLVLVHGGRYSKNHENFLDIGDSHGVEIRDSVTESDSSKHIRRLDEWIEEIKSGDQGVWWYFYSRNIRRLDAYWLGQFSEIGEKFVLRHFTPSALHLCEVCQHEVGRKSMFNRIKRLHRRRFPIICPVFWVISSWKAD